MSTSPDSSSTVPLRVYLWPHRHRIVLGGVLLLITNGLDKSVPWLLSLALDALLATRISEVGQYAFGVIGIAAVLWGVRTWSRVVLFNVGRDIEYQLRNELLETLHRLGSPFFARMRTGDIMSRATNDLGQVRLLVGFGLLQVVNATFAYTGAIALMLAISPELLLWALAPVPLFVIATRFFSKALFVRSRAAQQALSRLSDSAQEGVSGIRLVRAYGIEAFAEAEFEKENQNALEANMRLVLLRGLMWPVLMTLITFGTLIVIWRGGVMVLSDESELSVGQWVAFIAYLGQLVWPTLAFGFLLAIVQRGRVSYQRVREILDTPGDILDPLDPEEADGNGALRVDHLSFSRGETEVLKDISFEVPAGGSLAITGATGSGKSTLAALVPRLLHTPKERVFVGGVDVTRQGLSELRDRVGYAQQDAFLFSTTVAANIAFALPNPAQKDTMDRVKAAAKEAAIHDEIERMPEGYATVVGERGVQLSGGQKQRVALARALLSEPSILILDDPLSAVDAKTERLILAALDRAGENRTLVLITNRIAAASRTDEILVLDKGQVVERGTHQELSVGGGLYQRLRDRQALEKELSKL